MASALGWPLSELVLRLPGRRGVVLVETVCAGLLVRDLALIRSGAPHRLRRLPAVLLWLETVAAGVAVGGTGWAALRQRQAGGRAASPGTASPQLVRGSALGLLFGLHTLRFWIYLQPGQGRRGSEPELR